METPKPGFEIGILQNILQEELSVIASFAVYNDSFIKKLLKGE